jgi:AcrR family transcriptional regulator
MKKNNEIQDVKPRKWPGQERSRQTVEALLEAAARILDTPDQPLTTNHVAATAGVSVGSLYQYFPNSASIVATLIERHIDEEVAAASQILSDHSGDIEGTIEKLTLAFIDAHTERPVFIAALHAQAPSFGLSARMNSARDAQADAIAAMLNLNVETMRITAAAIEGVILRQLESDPAKLKRKSYRKVLCGLSRSVLAPV